METQKLAPGAWYYKDGQPPVLLEVPEPKRLSPAGEWSKRNPGGLPIEVDWDAVYNYTQWAATH